MSLPQRPAARHQPVMLTLEDLTADLVWPQLLKAGALALRPVRVGLSLVMLLAIAGTFLVANTLSSGALRKAVEGLTYALSAAASTPRQPRPLAQQLYMVFFAEMWKAVQSAPVSLLVWGALALSMWTIYGGAISRTAATDYALNRALSWPAALGFAFSRWSSLIAAQALPLLMIWGIALSIGVASLVLRVPGLNLLGGALWIFVILAGLVGAIIVVAYVAGQSHLVPGVACEGCDSIESLQRAFSLVWARPLRLVAYALLLAAQGVLLMLVCGVVVYLALQLSLVLPQAWSGERAGQALSVVVARAFSPTSITANDVANLDATNLWTMRGIWFWTLTLLAVLASIGVSYYWTASTLLYLAMRRIADGQDMREIWTESLVPGTLAAERPSAHAQDAGGSDDE